MDIDKRIKHALEQETAVSRADIMADQGLFSLIGQSFQGSLKGWVVAVNIFTLIMTAIMIWCGYRFFTASATNDLIYWGVCALAAMHAQVALKQWLFLEMYRNNLMREIKRVELAVFNLQDKA